MTVPSARIATDAPIYGSEEALFRLEMPEDIPLPILISAPHGGRAYPLAVINKMRMPAETQIQLEDRYIDVVAEKAAQMSGAAFLAARVPRAVIDLNRSEQDMDWGMAAGKCQNPGSEFSSLAIPAQLSARARSGLGLIPRRLHGVGEIWKSAFGDAEIAARIAEVHRPYHAALHDALTRIREKWGFAILLDVHSMPPLVRKFRAAAVPRIVIGDLHGASARQDIGQKGLGFVRSKGLSAAYNDPYAGGYVLLRHGSPADHIHALQIEICRSLYLDHTRRDLTIGHENMAHSLAGLAQSLAQYVSSEEFREYRG